MDFTQIMQRYVRLREKFEQGELNAKTFEDQVNSMVFKDEKDRFWQIGVESGKWYYYDGERWVQDDLDQAIEESEEASEQFPTEDIEEDEFNRRVKSILSIDPIDESQESSPVTASEDELKEESLFEDQAIPFSASKEKDPLDELLEDDEKWMAPAEEVEGLYEHLMETQPVSIESLLGEDKEFTEPTSDDDLEFLLGDATQNPTQNHDSTMDNYLADIAAYLAETQAVEIGDNELFEDSELSPEELELFAQSKLNINTKIVSKEASESSLALPPASSDEASENQRAEETAENPTETEETVEFEVLPTEPIEEAAEPVELAAAKPEKKKKKTFFIVLVAALAVVAILAAAFLTVYFLNQRNSVAPAESATEAPKVIDMSILLYDDFSNGDSGWPKIESETGYTGYHDSEFFYIFPIDPDIPTIAAVDFKYDDIKISVDAAQVVSEAPILTTYGVMCRIQENGDGYAFRITSDGQYVIERYENGVFQPINGWKFSEVVIANSEVNENHFEITCMGNQLIFGLNGQILDIAIDDTYQSGSVALIGQRGGWDSATEIHFDEFYLRRP